MCHWCHAPQSCYRIANRAWDVQLTNNVTMTRQMFSASSPCAFSCFSSFSLSLPSCFSLCLSFSAQTHSIRMPFCLACTTTFHQIYASAYCACQPFNTQWCAGNQTSRHGQPNADTQASFGFAWWHCLSPMLMQISTPLLAAIIQDYQTMIVDFYSVSNHHQLL